MKKVFYITLLSLSILNACKEDVAEDPVPAESKCHVASIATDWNTYDLKFTADDKHRIVSASGFSQFSLLNIQWDTDSFSWSFGYDANGNLSSISNTLRKVDLSYDGADLPTGGVVSQNDIPLMNITLEWNQGNLSKVEWSDTAGQPLYKLSTSYVEDNLKVMASERYNPAQSSWSPELAFECSSHDDKANAGYQNPLIQLITLDPFFLGKNNVIQINSNGLTAALQYEYDERGYPTKAIVEDQSIPFYGTISVSYQCD